MEVVYVHGSTWKLPPFVEGETSTNPGASPTIHNSRWKLPQTSTRAHRPPLLPPASTDFHNSHMWSKSGRHILLSWKLLYVTFIERMVNSMETFLLPGQYIYIYIYMLPLPWNLYFLPWNVSCFLTNIFAPMLPGIRVTGRPLATPAES